MKKSTLLNISAIVNTLFLLFHLTFYWLFNWPESLESLSNINKSVLLTFNQICILFLAMMCWCLFRYKKALIETDQGRALLIFFSLFYLIRITAEFIWFGIDQLRSPVVIALCLVPVICNLYCRFRPSADNS